MSQLQVQVQVPSIEDFKFATTKFPTAIAHGIKMQSLPDEDADRIKSNHKLCREIAAGKVFAS